MAVILPNASLRVASRSHPYARDTHGTPVPGSLGATRGPHPGSAIETTDGGTWSLRLDPLLDPVAKGDVVSDADGRSWNVLAARLVEIPGYPNVDYIAVTGELMPPEVP